MARRWLDEHGYGSTVDYLVDACRAVVEETGLLPHANAGALDAEDLVRLRAVTASQGMMIESVNPDLAAHRSAPDKTPARRLATLEAAGRRRHPVHHRAPGGHRRDPGRPAGHPGGHRRQPSPPRPRAGGDRPELPAQAGHLDAPAAAVPDRRVPLDHRRGPAGAPARDPPAGAAQSLRRPGPAARLGHRRLGRRLAGHRRPRQPRAGLAGARRPPRRHRGGRVHPGPPPDPLPRVRPRSRPVAGRADALPRARRLRRRGPGPRPPLVLGRRGAAARCSLGPADADSRSPGRSGRSAPPVATVARSRSAVGDVLAGVALGPGRRRGRDRHPVRGPGPRGAGGGRGGRPAPAPGGRRRGHLRRQPEHQLHQRLHVQVQVLRLLQGAALAQPPGHARTCSS